MNRSKIIKGLTIKLMVFSIFVSAQGFWAQSLSVEMCYDLSKNNYPLIKQYDLIEKSSGFTISNANKAYFPQLSVTGIGGYIFGGLPSFSAPGASTAEESNFQFIGIAQLNQVLWDGGATKSQKNIIKASAEIEKSNIDVGLYLLRERINQIYFGILLIDEQLLQLNLQQDLLEKNLQKIKLYNTNGLVYSTQVDEFKAEVIKLEQRKIEFSFTRKGFIDMLSFMIAQPLDENSSFEVPAEKIISANEFKRPELNTFLSQKKFSEAQASIDKVGLMPKIGVLGAGVAFGPAIQFGPSDLSSIALVGLNLSWNTNGLYKIKNNSELHKLNIQKINLQEEQFIFNTKLQLTQIKTDVDKKYAVLTKDNEIVELRTKIRNAYQKKFDNGLCSMLDLITATEKESEAKANKALHKMEWLLSSYNYSTTNGN